MLNTREPLSQVALDCGMCDQAHFTRVFRKVVGISPSVWRRQFQSEPSPINVHNDDVEFHKPKAVFRQTLHEVVFVDFC
jgi:hypothetical protein